MRDFLIFLIFMVLTVVMTWPWALHLRDATNDRLDSYAHAYLLWWGQHQTLHDPFHLFQANIFYPYKDAFAFGENDYGISLVFFPLFVLGLRPLTIHGLAILFGFAFSGYGMFRLTRTLTGSVSAAWIAGVIFAFIPYRFGQLDRLPLVFAGWIPLLFEALVLFIRERSWKRATWLGVAFCMNALTCLTWFVLTLPPLVLLAVILITHQRLWRERNLRLRAGVLVGASAAMLLPFTLPFYRAAKSYGFTRSEEDVIAYASIHLLNWLAIVGQNKFWPGLGARINSTSEFALFPGFLPLILIVAGAFLFRSIQGRVEIRILLGALDLVALLCAFIALLVIGYGGLAWHMSGNTTVHVNTTTYPLVLLSLALIARWSIAGSGVVSVLKRTNLLKAIRAATQFEALTLAAICMGMGFAGSFGVNFVFHRALHKFIPLFRSMRVPARWSMIFYLGLALLAGMGALRLAKLIEQHQPRLRKSFVCVVIVLAVLFEQRAAPLNLIRGEVDADLLTLRLRQTAMSGGVVDLPAGRTGDGNQRYMLRAADHERPIVVATNSFSPPLEKKIEALTHNGPIPNRLMDLLESIPASYLVVHQAFLAPEARAAMENFLAREMSDGRLRFIRRYDYRDGDGFVGHNDLYAVVKTEPQTTSEEPLPPPVSYRDYQSRWQELPPGFRDSGFLFYLLYKISFGRAPTFSEFNSGVGSLKFEGANQSQQFAESTKALVSEFTSQPAFKTVYDGKSNEAFVYELYDNALAPGWGQGNPYYSLIKDLNDGIETRATVLEEIANNEALRLREFDRAFLLMNYFAYLKRDPDPRGYDFWLAKLDESGDYSSVSRSFRSSYEHYQALAQH